jgi:hypothetical protein
MSEEGTVDSTAAGELRLATQLRNEIETSFPRLSDWIVKKRGCVPEPGSLVDALILAVTDPDTEVQEQALRFFANLRRNGRLPLRKALRQAAVEKRHPRFHPMAIEWRRFIYRSLTEMYGKPAAFHLFRILYSDHLLKALTGVVESEDPRIADLALELFLPYFDRLSEYGLVRVLSMVDQKRFVHLDSGLNKLGIVRALCRALKRPDMPLKFEVIRALGWCKPETAAMAVPILIPFLTEGENELRTEVTATFEMLEVEARPAIPDLIAVMGDIQVADELRQGAARALVACAPRDVDLRPARSLKNDDRQRVLEALCALESRGSEVRHQLQDAWRLKRAPTPQIGKEPLARDPSEVQPRPKHSAQLGGARANMIDDPTAIDKLTYRRVRRDRGWISIESRERFTFEEVARFAETFRSIRSELKRDARNVQGVSLFDVAQYFEGGDDVGATKLVKNWHDKKSITATVIGKCPTDGRKRLYRLQEILADITRMNGLDSREKAKLQKHLMARQRRPRI